MDEGPASRRRATGCRKGAGRRARRNIYQAEYRLHRASDDSYHWYLARAIPWRDANGTILGWFGSAIDIDDQKRAEEELAKSKAMLQATIDCLPFNFFAIGLDGRYMLQNAVAKAKHQMMPSANCPKKSARTRMTLPFGWTTIGVLLPGKRSKGK